MIICNHTKLDESYWKVVDGNIQTDFLCDNETEFYVIDPNRINSIGGSKLTITDPVLLKTNLDYVTAGGWSQPELGFRNQSWQTKLWSIGDDNLFLFEISNWVINNFNNTLINPDLNDFNLITVTGTFNSIKYTVAFCYPGSSD